MLPSNIVDIHHARFNRGTELEISLRLSNRRSRILLFTHSNQSKRVEREEKEIEKRQTESTRRWSICKQHTVAVLRVNEINNSFKGQRWSERIKSQN